MTCKNSTDNFIIFKRVISLAIIGAMLEPGIDVPLKHRAASHHVDEDGARRSRVPQYQTD